MNLPIQSALISVFYKDGLDQIVKALHEKNVTLYSTGGTRKFIEDLGIPCVAVEDITGYPSILGGRVKTLHPKVFGGILARRELDQDMQEIAQYEIPLFDLVMVDLYPFAETVAAGGSEQDIIEKIDIGGVSLIRAGAKNHAHTTIIAHKNEYSSFLEAFTAGNGILSLAQRKSFAGRAFAVTAEYDGLIADWFAGNKTYSLRYGENPHQQGQFLGNLEAMFTKHQGKELSYNNLLDVDSAVCLMNEFDKQAGATFVIIKHNNACGVATRSTVLDAWTNALACDPVSAFGGILATNAKVDLATATEINQLFFEVLIAPAYDADALELLKGKTNRIVLESTGDIALNPKMVRTALNGQLIQDRDSVTEKQADMKPVTETLPTTEQLLDLEFALKLVKQTKSNTIVLVKNQQLLASGTGQTSRVDALQQAIEKANRFGFDLQGAVMASDAFFPFPDCVEIADKSGITAVVQPGGSIKDQLSIDYCNANGIAMLTTGVRHFKH
ncbi:MAG: bifunctional phosphoribosylaminoimidazolecarboxamide formyltransferase/IMP cyclohydrolase [Sphingomonadales bacterium]|nr:bifunctional phosphoribosylaminoimidazolecarboxamide formyltransferase/IMP cyclohydrolase [Sphingomonadales bacterium]